jgi:hypothetical protein
LISQYSKENIKIYKLKLISYIVHRSLKEKKQNAFNSLRTQSIFHKIKIGGVKNVGLIMNRITKCFFKFGLNKLREQRDRNFDKEILNEGEKKPN